MAQHKYFIRRGRKMRMELDRKEVLVKSLHIIDNLRDQNLVIPAEEWPRYQPHSEVLSSCIVHKVIETPVLREIRDNPDPDIVDNEQLSRALVAGY